MPETIQRSFTSGEISPSLQSRADTVKYATGLNLCENFFVRAQGGVYSRPGFRFIGPLDDETKKGKLIPFSFNVEQTYILVFEHLKMRVIKDGGFVLDGGSIFELVTPYTEDELPRLGFTQSADVMTLVHHNHDPQNLNRFADDNWTLTTINYGSDVTPPVISSAVAVGSGAGTYSKTYTYVVTAVNTEGVESLISNVVSITTPSLSATAGVRLTWGAVADTDYYRVYKDPSNASGIYGWIGDSKNLTFDDYNKAATTSDAPPEDRQPFVGVGNKPSVVNYYQQRQILCNTLDEPQTVFTTRTAEYNSLRTSNPSRDDDAITFTIAARQVNEIRHIVALNSLILLTSGAEWKVTEGVDEVLTPSTISVKPQSYNGASYVPPIIVNSTVLYIQEKGAKVRDLAYEFVNNNYTGNDLSLMSEHLFEEHELVSMAYAAEPYGIVWCVRDDGILLGLTYQREHQVWGWHHHTTQGEFEDVATITEGQRDVPYVIVKREIDGVTRRYVERLEKREQIASEDCFYVDSGLSYDGTPVTVLSGLDHIEGEEVAVLADGNEVPGITVTGGQITLQREASKVHVGLRYTPVIETLDIDAPSTTESLKSKSLSVSKVYLEVEKSRGGWVGPRTDIESGYSSTMFEIKPRFDSDGYDSIMLKTFKKEIVIDPLWSKGGGIRVEQRSPLPLSILSIIPDITLGGN